MAVALLDTTVLIDILRGRPETRRRLLALRAAGDTPHVCAIGVEEVVRGLRPAEAATAERLFSGLRMVPLGRAEGWQADEWRRDFAANGVTLSQADCLVAAAALGAGGRLCTGNPKDFPMPELAVEHWPVGA
ncbi:MAG: PIN domain-containing protein [Actinobacteria bacterium]|nr:PIN domain-containing protein [Actinomycetota bacterium]